MKPIVLLTALPKTPPVGLAARRQMGRLLRALQRGEQLHMPHLRRMPSFGARCAELRVDDAETARSWRVAVRIDVDAVVLVEIFEKRTQQTPKAVVERVAARLRAYDRGE